MLETLITARPDVTSRAATPASLRGIAVLRALPGLGDALCVVPALRALRAAAPAATISLIGLPETRPLFARFTAYVDELLDFPGYPGLPEREPDAAALADFLDLARGRLFDLALQLHGSGPQSTAFTLQLGAARTAGFYPADALPPETGVWAAYPAHGHEIHRCLRAVALAGVSPRGDALEFPLTASDRAALARLPGAATLRPGAYAVVHPGASVPERRWPVERFAAVVRALAARGLTVVLSGATGERDLTRTVATLAGVPVLDLAGQTDLGALAALIADARLLICNDTGVSHLAAALRTPSVVIFPRTDVERWAPLDRRLHRRVFHSDGAPPAVEEALAAVAALLAEGHDAR